MSVPKPVFRRTPRRPARPAGRGFSLVELLAVIAILAILTIVGGQGILEAWKRQKLSSAATDIKVLIQRALPEMQRRGITTFIQVGPLVSNASVRYVPIYLIGDANGNGAIDAGFANPAPAGGDLLIDEYDLIIIGKTGVKGVTGVSQDFCLSVRDVMQVQSNRWLPPGPCIAANAPFCDNTDWTVARSLQCDFQGRAIDPSSGRQIAGPASFVLTHVDIVSGSLQPPTRYVLSVNPVWSVRIQKQTTATAAKDPASVWADQGGG